MAHSATVQARARAAYIHDTLPLEQVATLTGVPFATLARWKRQSREKGDDWDKLRAANLLAGEGVEAVARQMLADYVTQHKTLMHTVLNDPSMDAAKKVSALASLADSFNKIVAASKRVLPETGELAIALQTITLLAEFVRRQYPQHAGAIIEILEPFGEEVARVFG